MSVIGISNDGSNQGSSDLEDNSYEIRRSRNRRFTVYSLLHYIRGFFRKKRIEDKLPDAAVLELLQPARYKPSDIDDMSIQTKFSKPEVKFLYRAFKTECPNGILDEETFKEIYEKIFPMGDASKYSQIVFRAIDKDNTGGITFGDFMHFLSIISKGSESEKILWSFRFFDINQDGQITKEEMVKASESVFELMGVTLQENKNKSAYVDQIFNEMDTNEDGVVTYQEFFCFCSEKENVAKSLQTLP